MNELSACFKLARLSFMTRNWTRDPSGGRLNLRRFQGSLEPVQLMTLNRVVQPEFTEVAGL